MAMRCLICRILIFSRETSKNIQDKYEEMIRRKRQMDRLIFPASESSLFRHISETLSS